MGKCIGKHNLKTFYGFLWAIVVLIVYTGACFFTWIVTKAAK